MPMSMTRAPSGLARSLGVAEGQDADDHGEEDLDLFPDRAPRTLPVRAQRGEVASRGRDRHLCRDEAGCWVPAQRAHRGPGGEDRPILPRAQWAARNSSKMRLNVTG